MQFHSSHHFPSGLKIDFYTEVSDLYVEERNLVANQEALDVLVQKWKYLCPELVKSKCEFSQFKELRDNSQLQEQYVIQARTDEEKASYIELVMPRMILFLSIKAHRFGTTTGLIFLQLLNGNVATILGDGTVELKLSNKGNS